LAAKTMTKTFFIPRLWQGEDLPCVIRDARAPLTKSESANQVRRLDRIPDPSGSASTDAHPRVGRDLAK
jgi:hypothetical protein